jgi:Domain of unknown function (DUF6602)
MSQNKLAEVLHSVAKQMRAQFDTTKAVEHRGQAGASRESIVHDFIASYLPGHVQAAHSAEIVTATGDVSPQCDIVLFDRSTPPLLDAKTHCMLLNECVYGVIEVKTALHKETLIDACEKISKVKALAKTAYYPDPLGRTYTCYGKTYTYRPTFGMIFAFDSSDLATLGNHFTAWCAEREPDERPDSVWVLGEGYLLWRNPETGLLESVAEPGADLAALKPLRDRDVLLPLVLQLGLHLTTAWMPPLRLTEYAHTHGLGTFVRRWREETAEEGPSDAAV